jgi:hypothetical protein
VRFFLLIAVDPRRHQIDKQFRQHCGDGFLGAVRVELCANIFVPGIVEFLLFGGLVLIALTYFVLVFAG